jgi:GntR family negative regulator for fad regulon and positive regulator of fabA
MNWSAPLKPAEITEKRLIDAILDDHFPINSTLPGERDLASQLGVTRPTLREALQRLARDGWLDIQHGKATRVRNYWQEGNLAVLAAIAKRQEPPPKNFVPNLLYIRQLMAPAYTRLAIENNPTCIESLISEYQNLPSIAETYATADWELHRQLTICSNNPVFTLILNGFQDLYPVMGKLYFQNPRGRAHSQQFYRELFTCTKQKDAVRAEQITQRVMEESLEMWKSLTGG